MIIVRPSNIELLVVMPAAGASAEKRKLSNGRVGLPWLSERMPGEFIATSGESDNIVAPLTDGIVARDKYDSGLDAVGIPEPPRAPPEIPDHGPAPIEIPTDTQPIIEDDSVSPKTRPEGSRPAMTEQDRRLSRAVTDLERLMREAIEVAMSAAAQGRPEDVTEALRDATDTIHRASIHSPRLEPLPKHPDDSALLENDHRDAETVSRLVLPRQPTVARVGVAPNLPPPSSAEIVVETPGMSTTSSTSYRGSTHPLPAPVAAVRTRRNTVQRTDTGPANMARKSVKPSRDYTLWTPEQFLTNEVGDNRRVSRKPRRPDTAWDVDERDLWKVKRERGYDRAYDPDLALEQKPDMDLRRRRGFNFGHHTRRQPIARKWSTLRKRFTATVACINTGFAGYIIGVYAGEVPKIQFQVVDPNHYIILGNVVLFVGLAVATFVFWPLPVLHGRKPYTIGALAIVLPLQFPQAIVVSSVRPPNDRAFLIGLLLSRLCTGIALGFANVNFFPTLLDLFGASLQSSNPHQELVLLDDVRRQGGGMGIWLGIWAWCFVGSIATGFLTGAGIIAHLNPQWGFYITCIVGIFIVLLNVMAPETRRSPYRRSFTEFIDEDEKLRRRIARGEIKLHLESEGPSWWGEEVWAGIRLNFKMLLQRGFFVLAAYLGWTYALVVLVIVLLGSLLSREYHWRPEFVGLGVFSLGVGALLAIPLSKAGIFSHERTKGPRTDSMTFERQITRSSHMVRRIVFMLVLPVAGAAYTASSPGSTVHASIPIVFAGFIGFFANLGIAECIGIVMETFDTSDLQPGVNSRHRFKSMASNVKRRRTNYSSFPRITAGIFVSQTIGFLLAAAATGIGGVMTRTLGSQTATAITAGVLLLLTLLLTMALWRFKQVQVIPNHAFGTRVGTVDWREEVDDFWKPVVIGNPSGKMRRMNMLELGHMSRWTEIRKLNNLIRPETR